MAREKLNICFYISDYGYGHASRDIAIIRKVLEELPVRVFIKTDGPFQFIKQSLPLETCACVRTKNDIGLVFKDGSLKVDEAVTGRMLDQ